ncbi:hypothetical protein GI584_05310 [Gracilibacillus salitolerans]|uniref:Uncharacterized protein n=1 Tax=Gracilibacillus salitolerans TaxID=2663022 RepID=A0A5Q2TF98_9BACI|nr:hypothetical protein [Gracilibacillus salitolerans]QGH33474.1 hypothetical protein GI584_05310 [Gracilibacillus salitolerans]
MGNIVFARLDKIDYQATVRTIVDSVEQLAEPNETALFPLSKTKLDAVLNENNNIFIPATLLLENAAKEVNVYFDLENYHFFQKIKEVIEKENKPKGVFRLRRIMGNDDNKKLIATDLYVLSLSLGEPLDVQVKQTNQTVSPYHVIVTVDFGGGAMAHMEYTFSDQDERIELEWSGIKTILEFDSETMNSLESSLTYSVDAIIDNAHKVDQSLIKRLTNYEQLVDGGAH